MFPSIALPAAFFLSGAAGLVFQVVWLYRCSLVFGSGVAAVTVVLSGFMAGLATANTLAALFGTRVRGLLLAYAVLEGLVAATGMCVTYLLPHLSSLLVPLAAAAGGSGAVVNSARFGLAFAVLLVPATAMGATLPLLVAALCRRGGRFGSALGRLYGWNTLGAVTGVILSETILVRAVGVAGSAWVAALLNICAAGIAVMVRLKPDTTSDSVRSDGSSDPSTRSLLQWPATVPMAAHMVWPLYAATSLSGAVLLALEVVWFRFLSMYVLATTLAMSLMLAVVLAGIALGGLFAASGPPVAAYLLLPHGGMERGFFVLALAYGGVALLASLALQRQRAMADSGASTARAPARTLTRLVGGVLLLALLAFPFGTLGRAYFDRAAAAYGDDGSTIVATREGPSETLFVMQQRWLGQPVYSRLVTNGFSMSGTALQGQRYMRAFAYYPMLLHDGPLKRALVVCYGVGVTVGAVTHIPSVETIDVAEMSRDVVAMSDAIYPSDGKPLSDPRVRLHIEDGRFFLQTTSERFDLITGEPPPPRTPGTANIYTREYFQLVHDRLAEGGMATYWVPVARPRPGTDVNTILRAFCDVFSDCSLWNATPFDLILVGSRGASGPRTLDQFSAPWQTPRLEVRLREVGLERPEQVGAAFIGDAAYLNELTKGTPPLTDDFPQRLRPTHGRPGLSDPGYGVDPAVTRMYQAMLDVTRAREAFRASPWIHSMWPAPLIERTLPFFEQQALINRVYWEGGRPLRQIEDLDAVLTKTTLRTLPLWILGSDDVKQRIGEAGGDASGATEYSRGLRAISGRDFGGAAQWLSAAEQRG